MQNVSKMLNLIPQSQGERNLKKLLILSSIAVFTSILSSTTLSQDNQPPSPVTYITTEYDKQEIANRLIEYAKTSKWLVTISQESAKQLAEYIFNDPDRRQACINESQHIRVVIMHIGLPSSQMEANYFRIHTRGPETHINVWEYHTDLDGSWYETYRPHPFP